jgi:hypothetical protein
MLFSFGIVKNAQADQLLFPWIVKSNTVSTIISVVNTAGSNLGWNYLGVDQQLHFQYWYKIATDTGTAASQTIPCTNQSFKRPTSKDDLVVFDASANINDGKALFGDSVRYGDQSFKLSAAGPVRAFLIVDNDTPFFTNTETNADGTLYGEALVLELGGGAAWGYIAYNASGNSNATQQTSPAWFYDGLDALGEVIGGNGSAVEPIGSTGIGEVSPVVLQPTQTLTTRFFMTPIDNDGAPTSYSNDDNSLNQRTGNANAKIQLVYNPGCINNDVSQCGFYGGLFTDDESPIDFNKKKNIVCTSADTLQDLMTEAAYSDFAATLAPGWTMIDIQTGDLDVNENDRIDNPTDDMVVGKLEYTTGGFNYDGKTPTFSSAAFNNLNWIRNSQSMLGCVGINCVRNHVGSLLIGN